MRRTSPNTLAALLVWAVLSNTTFAQPGPGYSTLPSCGDTRFPATPGCGHPTSPTCAPPYRKCLPPEEPGPPRSFMEPPELPPVAPGAYAAPPRSGTTVGEQRGGEFGGIRIRIPELVIGLPRLEWMGTTRHSRASHMRLDEATAPYTANPHYELAVMQRAVQLQQLRALQVEADRHERAALQKETEEKRIAQEEGELLRLRESERQLREQLAQMQRQLQQIHSQLPCPPQQQCPLTPRAVPLETLPPPRPTPPPVGEPNCVNPHRGQDGRLVSLPVHYAAPVATESYTYQASSPTISATEMPISSTQYSRESMSGHGWHDNQYVPQPALFSPETTWPLDPVQRAGNQDSFNGQDMPVRLPPTTR